MKSGHSVRWNNTPFSLLLLLTFATAASKVASGFQFRNNNCSINSISISISTTNTYNYNTRSHRLFDPSCSMSTSESESTDTNNDRCGIDYPALVVFDLDACFWDQEMYEMPALPSKTVTGPLGNSNSNSSSNSNDIGVTGVYSGRHKISMHPGSMVALREHASRSSSSSSSSSSKYPGMKICFASSADTPFAEKIGRATLKLLEVLPGITVWDLVMQDWDGEDVNQIGRQPPLSSNKAETHFPRIRKLTGIPYDKMLFFDDCNWGDHVGMVGRGCREENGRGVVGHRTPSGLRVADWYKGLELYQKAQARS